MRELLRLFLDVLLGPRCPACDVRVYPADRPNHPKDCLT